MDYVLRAPPPTVATDVLFFRMVVEGRRRVLPLRTSSPSRADCVLASLHSDERILPHILSSERELRCGILALVHH
jgi:hypothetical protein